MDANNREVVSPFAKSVGAGAACLVIALIVCFFTYGLRALDFTPLRALITFEDHLYDKFHPSVIRLTSEARPVVFIDIDDQAISTWSGPSHPVNNTPRALIAGLTDLARHHSSAVIFLDFDFRDRLPDDAALKEELAKADPIPVLIPTYFASNKLPSCEGQSDVNAPDELEDVFSDLVRRSAPLAGDTRLPPSIVLVHPVLELGAYGLTEAACSFYRARFGPAGELVSREAAMFRAVKLAANKAYRKQEEIKPQSYQIRWTVGKDTDKKQMNSPGNWITPI